MINDENRMVRKQILKRLQLRPDGGTCDASDASCVAFNAPLGDNPLIAMPSKRQEQVLVQISDYINDKDHTVLLEFVRSPRAFYSLPPKFVSRLFDKKNIGLFVLKTRW